MGKRFYIILAILTVALTVFGGAAYVGYNKNLNFKNNKTSYQIYRNALNYTFNIRTEIIAKDNSKAVENIYSGSGFIIKEDNKYYLITNDHVMVSDENPSYVSFGFEHRLHQVRKVGWDKLFDLAVLEFTEKDFKVPNTAVLGDSNSVRVGDSIFVLGSPLIFNFVWSEGRIMKSGTYSRFSKSDLIAVDAVCNPGNSGGPLINSNGQVVGIVEAITGAHPICLAIPINTLKSLWPKIKIGEVKHGFLGLIVANLWSLTPADKKYLNLDKIKEADATIIAAVAPNSPAANGGLNVGDIILSYGLNLENANTPVKNAMEFIKELNLNYFLGDKVAIRFRRGEDYMIRELKLVDSSSIEKEDDKTGAPPVSPPPQTNLVPSQPAPAPTPSPFPNP